MVKNIDPPWMQGAKKIHGQDMLVVHMNNGELEGLDDLQGGPSIDPKTGIREYSALASIIEIPEVREIFEHVAHEIETHGDISPHLRHIYESSKKNTLPYREAPEEEHNPLHALERTGRDGDTKLAFIPLNLAFFLIELRHVPSINPKTGLLEFGLGKSLKKIAHSVLKPVVRIAAPIAGALLGGPAGAAVGGLLGTKITQHKPLRDSWAPALKNAALSGAVAYGTQGLGQAYGLSGSTPYTGGFFGGAPNALASGIGNYLGIGSFAPTAAGVTSSSGAASAIPSPIPSTPSSIGQSGSGLWNALSNPNVVLPLSSAALSYIGSKKDYKREKKYNEDFEKKLEKAQYELDHYNDWAPIKVKNRVQNPEFYSNYRPGVHAFLHEGEPGYEEAQAAGYSKGGLVKSYSKGTLVRGPGKGQDDLIKTTVPDGSYIIDASSTSMLGDGSSNAGAEILKKFENNIKNKIPRSIINKIKNQASEMNKQVPVWLSDSEYKIDPVTVTALGDGNNKKGASILKKMVLNLRKHKIRNGDGLPPKAKHPSYYLT